MNKAEAYRHMLGKWCLRHCICHVLHIAPVLNNIEINMIVVCPT